MHSKPLLAFLLYNKIKLAWGFCLPSHFCPHPSSHNHLFYCCMTPQKRVTSRYCASKTHSTDLDYNHPCWYVQVQQGNIVCHQHVHILYIHVGKKQAAKGWLHAAAACRWFHFKREAMRREETKNRNRGSQRAKCKTCR